MSETPTLAAHAKISRAPGQRELDLEIDGKPFPWYFAIDRGVEVKINGAEVSAITLTILVEHVEVDDQMMSGRADAVLAGHFHDEVAGA